MNYIIETSEARKRIKIIFDCVKKGEDLKGNGISTWSVQITDKGEEVLVHTADQWAKIGNLHLIPNKEDNRIEVAFRYWKNWTKENNKGDEDCYVLGRFTELFLVHFDAQYNKVAINK